MTEIDCGLISLFLNAVSFFKSLNMLCFEAPRSKLRQAMSLQYRVRGERARLSLFASEQIVNAKTLRVFIILN